MELELVSDQSPKKANHTYSQVASFARAVNSNVGVVGAKTPFDYLQSAGMGGCGAPIVNAVVRLSAATSSLGLSLLRTSKSIGNGTAKL